jgi:hypothetical protein
MEAYMKFPFYPFEDTGNFQVKGVTIQHSNETVAKPSETPIEDFAEE